MITVDLKLPVERRSPARARHALDEHGEPIPPGVLERFRIAVSELVTNAIQHGGLSPTDELRLTIAVFNDRIRVDLSYPGAPFGAEPRRPAPSEESGRGLMLVERAADRWGLESGEARQWFEIDLSDGDDVAA